MSSFCITKGGGASLNDSIGVHLWGCRIIQQHCYWRKSASLANSGLEFDLVSRTLACIYADINGAEGARYLVKNYNPELPVHCEFPHKHRSIKVQKGTKDRSIGSDHAANKRRGGALPLGLREHSSSGITAVCTQDSNF